MNYENVNDEQRQRMIAEAAYFRAERRGFNGGDPTVDWVEAETQIDAQLRRKSFESLMQQCEERLAMAGRKLQALGTKLASTKADGRAEWQPDIERLARLREIFAKRVGELREQGEQATHKLRDQVERTYEEISEAIERVKSRRKARGSASTAMRRDRPASNGDRKASPL